MNKEHIFRRNFLHVVKDFWLLMKPELTLLSVFTALCSGYMAMQLPYERHLGVFLLIAIATVLLGGGCNALNQYAEREFDARMKRTSRRPLPDLRMLPKTALVFAIVLSFFGTIILFTLHWMCALLGVATLGIYILLYTPLKRISSVSTVIGAIPGALPTLIGWSAIQHSLSIEALSIFSIVYYWQMPHFYAIGWMYKNEYAAAGYRLLISVDERGNRVSTQIILYQMLLTLFGLSPVVVGLVTIEYVPIAIASCLMFLFFGIQFAKHVQTQTSSLFAKKLFFVSLIYLPVTFSTMILCKVL